MNSITKACAAYKAVETYKESFGETFDSSLKSDIMELIVDLLVLADFTEISPGEKV